MARRGKTRVGGGPRQDTMMRAQETGKRSQERVEGQRLQQIEQGGQQGTAAIQRGAQGIQQELGQRRREGVQQEQFAQQQGLAEQRQELSEAQAGFERVPEQPETSQRDPQEVARLQEQGEKSLEFDGQGGVVSGAQQPGSLRQTEAGKAAGRARAYESETKRMNAVTARMNAEKSYATARAGGNSEQMEAASKAMIGGMKTTRDSITKTITGETDPAAVLQAYSDNPDALAALESGDPALQTQTAVRMQRNELATQNIAYMASTGGPPIDFDPSNEIWQKFSSNHTNVSASLRSGMPMDSTLGTAGALQAWQGITSEAEKERFLNSTAAKLTMAMSQAEAQAEAISSARRTQEQIMGLQGEIEGLRQENEMLKSGFQEMGSPEFGQPVPKTQETLPGGQQVESGMEHRRGQYKPPGGHGLNFDPYKTGVGVGRSG